MTKKSNADKIEHLSLEERIFQFLELSQKLLTLVQHENSILQTCGCLSFESYLEHRNSLLINYEEAATKLIADSLQDSVDEKARLILSSELSAVRDALSDNTVQMFQSLKKRYAEKDEVQSWH
jgi:hypothetical protein